ncbi:hypothetical protein V493_02961 [Pseudogymnoascus sp. VKM F-4281 (FW-2241)]|nr:hypothetical protein V493_02961 [Pseudogymnoascus sp. VKM F-4281 (FW-2241)]
MSRDQTREYDSFYLELVEDRKAVAQSYGILPIQHQIIPAIGKCWYDCRDVCNPCFTISNGGPLIMSMAKEAQTKLAELEKEDAPIAEQLEQAGQFAGIEWLDFLQTAIATPGEARTGNFHGREEWVLRWLLKKLAEGAGADGGEVSE